MDSDVTQVSSFPLPPLEHVAKYSNSCLKSGLAPPPPPPLEGHYRMFGESLNTEDEILLPLETQGIKQLYLSGADPRQELKRLTRSLVAAFLDLVEILIRYPDSPERVNKLNDLRLLFFNTHHLINEYRPHQARETLHLMLEVQKRERIETVEKFRQHFEAVKLMLNDCLKDVPEHLELSSQLEQRVSEVLNRRTSSSITVSTAKAQSVTEKDKLMCRLTE